MAAPIPSEASKMQTVKFVGRVVRAGSILGVMFVCWVRVIWSTAATNECLVGGIISLFRKLVMK